MTHLRPRLVTALLDWMPLWLLLLVGGCFALLSSEFLRWENQEAIVKYSASTAITAIGMTFVLLTAGIDLSVGALMLVCGAVGGKMLLNGGSVFATIVVMLLIGLMWGAWNGLLITRLKMVPFVVTLGMLFVGRGIGLWITQTKPMNLPESYGALATRYVGNLPVPVWLLLGSLAFAHLLLNCTPLGRQVYAIGDNYDAAIKAGIPVRRNQLAMYACCGLMAALGGAITLSQLSAVSPTMASGRELNAIAAAVLGGVSLFGGRGTAFGAALGAILIETIHNGLTIVANDPQLNVSIDPYYYPLITGAILFVAVLIDSLRKSWIDQATRRFVRPSEIR